MKIYALTERGTMEWIEVEAEPVPAQGAVLEGEVVYDNLVENPGFETGNLSGWTAWGDTGYSAQAQNTVVYAGSYSCQLVPPAGGKALLMNNNYFDCKPRTIVGFSFAIRGDSNIEELYPWIEFYDYTKKKIAWFEGNNLVEQSKWDTELVDTWIVRDFFIEAYPNARYYRIGFTAKSKSAAAGNAYIDNVFTTKHYEPSMRVTSLGMSMTDISPGSSKELVYKGAGKYIFTEFGSDSDQIKFTWAFDNWSRLDYNPGQSFTARQIGDVFLVRAEEPLGAGKSRYWGSHTAVPKETPFGYQLKLKIENLDSNNAHKARAHMVFMTYGFGLESVW